MITDSTCAPLLCPPVRKEEKDVMFMCYAGGPYCDNVASARLSRARTLHVRNKTEESFQARKKAQEDYDGTPDGQRELLEQIEDLKDEEWAQDEVAYLRIRQEKSAMKREVELSRAKAKEKRKKNHTKKLYRAGEPVPAEKHNEDMNSLLDRTDALTPEGRQTRRGAVFASADTKSHARWVRGTSHWGEVRDSYEMEVDPEKVYVYPVESYENASENEERNEHFEYHMKNYWGSGVKLSCWEAFEQSEKPTRGSWEALVPPDAIQSYKKMTAQRVISNASPEDNDDLNRLLRHKQWMKGNLIASKYSD